MAILRPECRMCHALSALVPDDVDRTIVQSDRHAAIASLGALVEGWTLVLPKQHVLSLRDLSGSELDEFQTFAREVQDRVESRYGNCVAFEHGPLHADTRVGCGVDHAHLHLVPWDRPALAEVVIAECPELTWEPARSLADVQRVPHSQPYVWIATGGSTKVGWGPEVPSQLVRRAIAKQLGITDEFDWRAHPRISTTLATIGALRPTEAPLVIGTAL